MVGPTHYRGIALCLTPRETEQLINANNYTTIGTTTTVTCNSNVTNLLT